MDEKRLLPIKVVARRKEDIYTPDKSGRTPEPLEEVTIEIRRNLISQINSIQNEAREWFGSNSEIPVVGKVQLKEKALAKSHRPTKIFRDNTCPIIGVKGMGQLLIKVTPEGLTGLRNEIRNGESKSIRHNISTISNISLYNQSDALPEEIEEKVKQSIVEQKALKVELFKYGSDTIDSLVNIKWDKFVKRWGCKIEDELIYSDSLKIFRLICPTIESLEEIKKFLPIKRLSFFPNYHAFRTVTQPSDLIMNSNEWEVDEGEDYPIVAVVDSGIPDNHVQLEKWIVGREKYIPDAYTNYKHGTFVGGLVAHAHILDKGMVDGVLGCRILDIRVLPNDDPDEGDIDSIDEWRLITCLEDALKKYSNKVKVWNLSLGADSNIECDEFNISDFATKLDQWSDEYKVAFVIASGNYQKTPLRRWPAQKDILDKITSPADSIRGITVGSIAGQDKPGALVKKLEPSPFSRRGPGPSYIIKPELVHVGGNCNALGEFDNIGVFSWSPKGGMAESIGTSFSTPRISRLLAGVYSSMNQPPSLNLAKALVVHSAFMPGQIGTRPMGDDLHYYGFGMPGDLQSILTCNNSTATIIWETEIVPGMRFDIKDFPYPDCLFQNGRWFGSVLMTLVYDPPIDHNNGFECCRLNLDAHLGVHKYSKKDKKLNFHGQVPPDAQWNERYEKSRVAHGFKWSPIKVYRQDFVKGITGQNWRLYVEPLLRSEEHITKPQSFTLIISIIDTTTTQPVYDDVVRQLQRSFVVSDLAVNNRIRNSMGF